MTSIRVHALIDNLGFGGAEILLSEFARPALASGIEMSVTYLKEADVGPQAQNRLERLGVQTRLVRATSMVSAREIAAIRRSIRAAAPDIVHTHLGVSDTMGGVAARSLRLPCVSTIHAMDWEAPDARERVKLRLMGLARRRCAARVIAVSETARDAYLATGWDRPERVVRVYNGVAGEARPGSGRRVREELGIAPEAPVAVMLSALRPEKAHDVAVAAVMRVRDRFPGLRLIIVGDGDGRPEVERVVAEAGDTVLMTGYRGDVMETLDAADVLLHPSRIDAFPTALLEAMAASLPIVATNVGGIPEMVTDGESGLLVEPPPDPGRVADALATLLGDPDLRRRLAAAGRARFESEFTLERWVTHTRAVYEEVLAERGR